MTKLSPDWRNYLYLQQAESVGIHKPILAALYAVHKEPTVTEEETGLGISPANRIPWERLNSFVQQVEYAANTIRTLTETPIDRCWEPGQLWEAIASLAKNTNPAPDLKILDLKQMNRARSDRSSVSCYQLVSSARNQSPSRGCLK